MILQSKESSNQKTQENKLALEIIFTWESPRPESFWDVLVICQQCHRALLLMLMTILTTIMKIPDSDKGNDNRCRVCSTQAYQRLE